MPIIRPLPLVCAALALAGCQSHSSSDSGAGVIAHGPEPLATPPPDAGAADDPTSNCGAERARTFVGQPDAPNLRSQITAATGNQQIRWLYPNTPATHDFRIDRLNVMFDAAGKVISANCG